MSFTRRPAAQPHNSTITRARHGPYDRAWEDKAVLIKTLAYHLLQRRPLALATGTNRGITTPVARVKIGNQDR